jgi:pimeloyl-ACP methyl ester carboxylesterase
MAAVGIDRATLVGHSIGCQVVAHLAARHADRVSSLVLASPTGDPATSRWRQAALLLGDAVREAPRLVPIAVSDYVRAGPLRTWHTFGLARNDDMIERLRRLPQRCTVVRGGHDGVVSAEWTHLLAAAVRAEPVTIPRAPHGLPFSAAPQLSAVIEDFLAA